MTINYKDNKDKLANGCGPSERSCNCPHPTGFDSSDSIRILRSYEKRSHRVGNKLQYRKFLVQNQSGSSPSDVDHMFDINHELNLPIPNLEVPRKRSQVAAKPAKTSRSKSSKARKYPSSASADDFYANLDRRIGRKPAFPKGYLPFQSSSSEDLTIDYELESLNASHYPEQVYQTPPIEGRIVPWVPPYPTVTVIMESPPSIIVHANEYTLCWLDTSRNSWDGTTFGGLHTRSIYDIEMPPLSDYTYPSVEFNQLVQYSKRPKNESSKEYARSKWSRKEETKLQAVLRQVHDLMEKNRKKTEENLKLREKLRAKFEKKSHKRVQDEGVINSPDYLFLSIVDIEKSDVDVAIAFQLLCDAGTFANIRSPHEIVRLTALKLATYSCGVTFEAARKSYKTKSKVPWEVDLRDKYRRVLKEKMRYHPGIQFNIFPGIVERFVTPPKDDASEEFVFPAEEAPPIMNNLLFVSKISMLISSMVFAETWESALLEVSKFILYSATSESLNWLFGEGDRKSAQMRSSVQSFLEARLKKLGPVAEEMKPAEKPENVSDDSSVGTECVEFDYPAEIDRHEGRFYTPTIVEIPPKKRVEDQSAFGSTANPFAILREGFDITRDIARRGIGLEHKIKEIPVLELIDEVLCLIVFFSVKKPEVQKGKTTMEIPESYLYKEILKRAFAEHKTDGISLVSRICTVVDLALMISATLWDGTNVSVLFNPLDIPVRLGKLNGLKNAYAAGNLDILAEGDKGACTTAMYEKEVVELTRDIRSLLENKMVKPQAEATYSKYLAMANELQSVIKMAVKARTEKPLPYMIGLYGKAGVGKSLATDVYMSVLAEVYNITITPQSIWMWNPDPNSWDTGATSSKNVIQVSEHDNIKTVGGDAPMIFFDMARICDTLPNMYKIPDLERKGLVYNMLRGGIFLCNQKDFGIGRVKEPSATARRCDFFELRVMEKYGKKSESGDYFVPDPDKIMDVWNPKDQVYVPNEDIYEIRQYHFCVKEVQGDNSGTNRSTSITDGEWMSLPQWRTHLKKRMLHRLNASNKYNTGLKKLRTQTLCKVCANPYQTCSCDTFCSPVPPDDSEPTILQRLRGAMAACCGSPSPEPSIMEVTLASWDSRKMVVDESPFMADPIDWTGLDPNGKRKSYIPIWVAVGPVRFFANILRRFTKGAIAAVLGSIFNLYTSVVCSMAFFWCPPLCIAILVFMLSMTYCVSEVSRMISERIIEKDVARGEITPYWDVSYRKLCAVALGVVAAAALFKFAADSRKKPKEEVVEETAFRSYVAIDHYHDLDVSCKHKLRLSNKRGSRSADLVIRRTRSMREYLSMAALRECDFMVTYTSRSKYADVTSDKYWGSIILYRCDGRVERLSSPPGFIEIDDEPFLAILPPLVTHGDSTHCASTLDSEKWETWKPRTAMEYSIMARTSGKRIQVSYSNQSGESDTPFGETIIYDPDGGAMNTKNPGIVYDVWPACPTVVEISKAVADEAQRVDTRQELDDKLAEPDLWLERVPLNLEISVPHSLKTSTLPHITALLAQQSAHFISTSQYALNPKAGCKALFLTANVVLMPIHRDGEIVEGLMYKILRGGTANVTDVHVLKVFRIVTDGCPTDMCFVLLDTRFPMRNIYRLLSHNLPDKLIEGNHKDVGEAVLLNTSVGDLTVFPQFKMCETQTRKFPGLSSIIPTPTTVGDCGSCLVTTESPHLLIGFHISRLGEDESHCTLVCYSEWERFLSTFDEGVKSSVLFSNVYMDNKIPTCPSIPNDDPSPRVCTKFVRNEGPECTETMPSVTVFGHDKSARVTSKSTVEITPMSDALEDAGWPRLHGPPKLNNNRASATILQYGARGASPRGVGLNSAVIKHWVRPVAANFRELGVVPRPFTVDESLRGVPDDRYAKSMAMNKACGGGCPGKKKSRVDYTGTPNEEEVWNLLPAFSEFSVSEIDGFSIISNGPSMHTDSAVIDDDSAIPTPKEDLMLEVASILDSWYNGTTCNTLVWGALKDEPTLLTKILSGNGHGRLVTSQSMAHHIAQTALMGDVVGKLRALPLVTGCYEGMNYQSQEWHETGDWHMSLGPIEDVVMIDMDTKKMDLSMNNQDLVATTTALAMLVRESGGSEDHAALIEKCGWEMSTPIISLFGEYVSFSMNTSGNKLTIVYNNLSGVQFRIREAYVAFKIWKMSGLGRDREDFLMIYEMLDRLSEEECLLLLEDFSTNVRVGSIGDDCILSTIMKFFDMDFITHYFLYKGVQITGSDKTADLRTSLSLRDISACQRGFRWCKNFGRIVGPLKIQSLSRTIHCTMPSAEKPSIVERNSIRTVLEELVFHGEEVFEERKAMIMAAVLATGRMHIHGEALSRDYWQYLSVMKKRFPTTLSRNDRLNAWERYHHGTCDDGLVDQRYARATYLSDRLQTIPMNPREGMHPIDESGFIADPDAGTCRTSIRISNETLNNIEFVTPSSTTDATVVAASQSAESQIVHTHDTPITVITRPVRLRTYVWNVGGTLNTVINPWQIMLNNPVIRQKLEFFKYMRAKLRITVLIDGNMFHSGLAWIVYHPLHLYDEITEYEFSSVADMVELSQRPKISISPRDSQGGEMLLPFIFHRDFIDLTTDDISKLGQLVIRSVVPLAMANGGNQGATITIMASFEDLVLDIPTAHQLSVPILPKNESGLTIDTRSTFANGSGFPSLTGTRSSVTADPSVMWAKRASTKVNQLGKIEAYIGTYAWNSSAGIDTVLASFRCSPFHGLTQGTGIGTEYHVTPSAWLALPYTYWSGTCVYRFEIVCSSQHRGKLMFTWDPIYTKTDGQYNKNYSVVVDIGEKTEHCAAIGWGQDLPFLPTITGMSQLVNQSVTEYKNVVPYANGTLTMTVFSPLVLLTATADPVLQINIYQRMSDDYKLVLYRTPLAGSSVQRNNNPPALLQGAAYVSAVPSQPVVNPTLTTLRIVDICEAPMPLLFTQRKRSGFPGLAADWNDPTFISAIGDVDIDRVRLPTNGTYEKADALPLSLNPVVIRVRGFVEGGTDVTLTIPTRLPQTISTTLTGITDVKDMIIDSSDTETRFNGIINVSATSRFEVVKAIHQIPKWGRATLRFPGVNATIPDLTPLIQWYERGPDGTPGAYSSNQSPVDRTNVMFKFVLPPGNTYLSNIVYSYLGNSATTDPIWYKSPKNGVSVLPSSGAGERRHLPVAHDSEGFGFVPAASTIGFIGITYLRQDDAAVRSAIKSQPVTPTVNEADFADARCIQHGPDPINEIYKDFFEEIVPDIMDPMRQFRPYSVANVVTSLPGYFAVKYPFFPLIYRDRLNSDNATEIYTATLFEYYIRAFICMRGSTEMMLQFESRGSTISPSYAKYTRVSSDGILTANSPQLQNSLAGYKGVEYFNPRIDNKVTLRQPWFNRDRFAYARSTSVANHNPHAARIDCGYGGTDRIVALYRVGDDFSLGHFLSTPVLRAAS